MNTIIEQIKAEIERLYGENHDHADRWDMGFDSACEKMLDFIDTLESGKPLELEKEIERMYANDTTTLRTRHQYAELARHFYELGQQSKPKVRFPHEKDIVDKVFGAGNLDGWEYDEAKALVELAKEELLKDAVEGDIGMTLHDKRADLYVRSKGYLPESLGIKCNDKVRIIIAKED